MQKPAKELIEIFGINIIRALDEEDESKIISHNQVSTLLFFFPLQVAVLSFLIYMLQRKQPPEVLCWRNVLEGFAEFPEEHMCRSLFVIGRQALAQVFFCACGFRGIYGLPRFIEHLGATASVTKNTGVTSKQHTITANMVDLTKPMFSFVCITMPTRL